VLQCEVQESRAAAKEGAEEIKREIREERGLWRKKRQQWKRRTVSKAARCSLTSEATALKPHCDYRHVLCVLVLRAL
jgi:Ribonuclease G/E